jgi:hypothetical protein
MLICTIGISGTKNKLFNWYQHDGTIARRRVGLLPNLDRSDPETHRREGKRPGEGRKEGLR